MTQTLTGLMMNRPLLIRDILLHAERCYSEQEILSVTPGGELHHSDYQTVFQRSRRLANALQTLGVSPGDKIATLAWNDYRHLEIYYAVACSGFVCHTINPRLTEEQIRYIINHAEDRWIFTAVDFVPLLEKLLPELKTVRGVVILEGQETLSATTLANPLDYEQLLAAADSRFDWPDFSEHTASSLCYTSGTTGHPKGVLYSHRSTVLHTLMSSLAGSIGLQPTDTAMPVVPMFHVNAWGIPYSAALAGARLILPGPHMGNGELLQRLIEQQQVTVAFGVPTIWLALLNHLEQSGTAIPSLKRIFTGGTACPRHIMDTLLKRYGVSTVHLWGMTELSPLGTLNQTESLTGLSDDQRLDISCNQGRASFGVEMKLKDDDNRPVPNNGTDPGRLFVRGYAVCSGYLSNEAVEGNQSYITHDDDGWLDTGDIATIDPQGYLHITDRAKDVIKSGGEWISSITLENLAMAHPEIAEAAAIAMPNETWGERPLIVAVKKSPSAAIDETTLLSWYQDKLPRWMHPDKIVFMPELPHTATGKVIKSALRRRLPEFQAL